MEPRELLLGCLAGDALVPLSDLGFSFTGSSLRLFRVKGDYQHTVSFSLSKWNSTNSCQFWTMWDVSSPGYAAWVKQEWGVPPASEGIAGVADWNIPGWPRTSTSRFHLRNEASDQDEVGEFVAAAVMLGVPYLERNSSLTAAGEGLEGMVATASKAADLYALSGDRERAADLLRGWLDRIRGGDVRLPRSAVTEMEARLERYSAL